MSNYSHDYMYYKGKRSSKYKQIKDDNQRELVNKIKYNMKLNRFDTALSLIEEYLSFRPNNYYILGYKAMALYRIGKKDDALNLFERILNERDISKRDELFIMSQYANILSTFDISLAIYYYEKVIEESDYLELVARGKLSTLYSNEKRYDDAINILKIDGFNNKFLNVKRATVYLDKSDFKKALRSLKKPEYNDGFDIKENFEDEYIAQDECYIRGYINYKKGDFDNALKYLTEATCNKKRNVYFKAAINIAKISILKGNFDEAINYCEEIKKQCPSEFFFKIIDETLAKAYAKKNDYKKAEQQYKKIETDEKHKNINLGKLELIKGNFEKAEEYLSIIDIKNIDVNINYDYLYRLALVKIRLKKYDEAKEILKLFDTNKKSIEVVGLMKEINRMNIYLKTQLNEPIKYEQLSYSGKQINSYNEEDALNHIIENHVYNEEKSLFNEDIDVKELFKNVKELLTKDKVVYEFLFDKYIINYRNIGYNQNKEIVHQLLILTVPDTKDIITMYPLDGTESIFTLEELEEKDKPKVKRLSQIEKFNMKYGNS